MRSTNETLTIAARAMTTLRTIPVDRRSCRRDLLGARPVRQDHNQRQRSEEDRTNDKCRQPADVLVRVPGSPRASVVRAPRTPERPRRSQASPRGERQAPHDQAGDDHHGGCDWNDADRRIESAVVAMIPPRTSRIRSTSRSKEPRGSRLGRRTSPASARQRAARARCAARRPMPPTRTAAAPADPASGRRGPVAGSFCPDGRLRARLPVLRRAR